MQNVEVQRELVSEREERHAPRFSNNSLRLP